MDVLTSEPVQALLLINGLLTLSLLIAFMTGVWSLGLPGFMCIGAYASSWLTVEAGWGMGPALAAGALAGMALSLPFALLALRVRGINLAIATLAAAQLVALFFSYFRPTGGVVGFMGMPFLDVSTMAAIVAVVFVLTCLLYASRLGKAMLAAGLNPLVASCNGISVPRLQLLALLISGMMAGLAGAFYGHYYSFISPGAFGFDRTITILLFLVAGGLTPWGAVAGSTLLTLLPQFIHGLESWAPALYGVVVIVIMAFAPAGLLPKNRLRDIRHIVGRLTNRRAQSDPTGSDEAASTPGSRS